MKSMGAASILALALVSFTTADPASAQSSRGSYRFLLEDLLLKSVDFNAATDPRGTTSGQMTFTDDAAIPDVVDAGDTVGDAPPQFSVSVNFDTLNVERNRALMSGTVVDSTTHRTYIGKWAQLVVEDNGGDPSMPDNLTWTFCQPDPGGWIPSDAELPFDNGAYLSWWATDAERPDDIGIPSKSVIPGQARACPVYPLGLYSLVDLVRWDGRLYVLPQ